MYIIVGICLTFLLLFVYSACVVSGRCAREEEIEELMMKRKGK